MEDEKLPARDPVVHDALPINDIRMHCLEYPSDGPPILLLHSLSSNGHLFDGLVAAGLASVGRLIVPDMRGRGRTEAPMVGYSLDQGCNDLIALLDRFQIDRVTVCGHSFGGLLALYFAACHPERVSRLIMLDAAADMHPAAPMMVALAGARLDAIFPTADSYLAMIRMAPFVNRWYEEMRGFVMADVQPLGFLMNTTRSRVYTAALASLHIYSNSPRDWRRYAAQVQQPTLLVQATEPFYMGMPMLTDDGARGTVDTLADARHAHATGNHLTMLFGPGADQTVAAIRAFVSETRDHVVAAAAEETPPDVAQPTA
jgi:pimeloyl-ACP methyl ester carboxylesterase